MTAKNLSHFKLKLQDISRNLYLENDWQMPRGLMNSKDKDPRNFTLAEWQQAKRMGHNARDLKAMMQDWWAVSDSKAAFSHALQEHGLILAKGDRRGHVAITHEGEVLSIARYVGRKAKEVTAKLGTPDDLPSVDQAKARQAQDMRAVFQRHVAEAKEQKRRALEPLEQRRKAMVSQQQDERAKLDQKQKARQTKEAQARSARLKSGMKGIWQRLSGDHARIRKQNQQESYAAFQRDRTQRESVIFEQMRERRDLQAQIKVVRKRHAAIFREIRQNQQHYRQMERDTAPTFQRASPQCSQGNVPPEHAKPRAPTSAERLERLRTQKPIRNIRDRGPERER